MARITIDQHGTISVTMDDGTSIPVPPGWESISIYKGPKGEPRVELISYPNGGEFWFTDYRAELIDPTGGLADGRTYTAPDGGTRTRYGQELCFQS